MLSPGEWYKRVPRERRENLALRRRLIEAGRNPAKARALAHLCSQDILSWINLFVWQYNPNTIGSASEEEGPFITWDFQDEAVLQLLWCVENRADVLIEKSREMGASWLCLLVQLWLFLFRGRKKFLCISRDENAVDRPGDSDSLFWKMDFVIEHLPAWLRPPIKRHKLRMTNEANRSSITGQASTGKAGVGGRATAMFIDEFSQVEEDWEVLQRTSDTTGCRIFNGTHRGTGTAFHELAKRPDWRKITMHWSQHPDKRRGLYRWDYESKQVQVLDKGYEFPADFHFVMDGSPTGGLFPGLRSPWYDEQCRRKPSKVAIAMDLDVDPEGSGGRQFFDALMVRILSDTHARTPYWEGDVEQARGKVTELKKVSGGKLKLWCTLRPDGSPPLSRYGAGADIAVGTGATPSCLSMVNARTGEKVLEYADAEMAPENFAELCVALCRQFVDEEGVGARFAWEMAGPGLKFGKTVLELGYRHVYFRAEEFTLAKETSDKAGWYPTDQLKRLLLEDYRAALANGEFINRSALALKECLHFVFTRNSVASTEEENENDPSGSRINHGDRVIADALAWKMAKRPVPIHVAQREQCQPGSMAWRREQRQRAEEEVWVS